MEQFSKTAKNYEVDQPWRYNPNPSVRGVSLYSSASFSWPPRSYTCSFCKREFRSAQALGGHMNVHRRDRARLHHFSPPLNPNPNPNTNPNCNPSTKLSIPNLNFAPPSLANETKVASFYNMHATLPFFQGTKVRDFMKEDETVRLELEMSSSIDHLEDGLDLELRLGFSY